jgi:hypothetical protein
VRKFLKKTVRKILVVPEYPMDLLKAIVREELGITIITYTISVHMKVNFLGLKNL